MKPTLRTARIAHAARALIVSIPLLAWLAPQASYATEACVHWTWLDTQGTYGLSRQGHTAILDPVQNRMIVFGGDNGPQDDGPDELLLGDIRSLSLTGETMWSEILPGGSGPSARMFHTAVFDPRRYRMIVFGGRDAGGSRNDMWALSLGEPAVWTELHPAGVPPPERLAHAAIYDPIRDRMIVFGGLTAPENPDGVTWTLDFDASPDGVWSPLATSGTPPPPMSGASAVYDPVRDRMFLFAGRTASGDTNSVWTLALSSDATWSELGPTGTPPPNASFRSAVYDRDHDRVDVYGGSAFDANAYALSLSGGSEWSTFRVYGGPPGERQQHAAVFDSVGARMVVFGGGGPQGEPGSVVETMTELTDTQPLTVQALPRVGGFVYQNPTYGSCFPTGTVVRLFAIPSDGHAFTGWSGDVTGTANPVFLPMYSPRNVVAMFRTCSLQVVADPPEGGSVTKDPYADHYVPGSTVIVTARAKAGYAFRGWSGSLESRSNPLRVTLDQATTSLAARFVAIPPTCGGWTAIDTLGSPRPRRAAASAYDPLRRRLVVFGGYDGLGTFNGPGEILNDLWELSLTTWEWRPLLAQGTPLAPRVGASAVYDPVGDRFLLLFGLDGRGRIDSYFTEVWSLSLAGTPAWTQLEPIGTPPGRSGQSVVYDAARQRLLVFGGLGPGGGNDLWQLDLSGGVPAWSELIVSNGPSRRQSHIACIDPVRDRMLIFGGGDASDTSGDLWSLGLSGTGAWRNLSPQGTAPSPRVLAGAAYDAERDRMLLFGGSTTDGYSNETWALSLAHGETWVDLSPYSGPAPEPRGAYCAAFDPAGDQWVVFGGVDFITDLNDATRLVLGRGHALDLTVQIPQRGFVDRTPDQGCYDPGSTVTLTAIPAEGQAFAGWEGDATGDVNPLAVVMDRHKAITARFEPVNTVTLLAQFAADLVGDAVELRWSFGDPSRIASTRIERAESESGPWLRAEIEPQETPGGLVALDRAIVPGRAYFYRLVAELRDGTVTIFGPISTNGSPLESAIGALRPNPSEGTSHIDLAISQEGHVRAVVCDLAGRRVVTLCDGIRKPGRYSLDWDGRSAAGRVQPGVYFVRVETPGRSVVRRLVFIR